MNVNGRGKSSTDSVESGGGLQYYRKAYLLFIDGKRFLAE
jgi:hypothetical protein